jgi:ribosomal protein RSM22 (predicted rRNA methylase)
VLAPARKGSGKVTLKLCNDDGSLRDRLVTKREGDLFRTARRLDWGDALE